MGLLNINDDFLEKEQFQEQFESLCFSSKPSKTLQNKSATLRGPWYKLSLNEQNLCEKAYEKIRIKLQKELESSTQIHLQNFLSSQINENEMLENSVAHFQRRMALRICDGSGGKYFYI